jgi:hypothetical protein
LIDEPTVIPKESPINRMVPNSKNQQHWGSESLDIAPMEDQPYIPKIPLTKKTFGHTFTTHGEEMTNFLTNRAQGSGMPQGQFLHNQKAALFILENLDKTKNGAVSLEMPYGFPARIIHPDGSFSTPSKIKLVPSGNGVKTAYPEP